MKRFIIIGLVLSLLPMVMTSAYAFGEDQVAVASDQVKTLEEDTPSLMIGNNGQNILGMVTGSPTGTYYRFGYDIKDAIKNSGVEINVKESKGSITNIRRIGSNENAAFGIVQSDVLGFLSRSAQPESKKLAENLRMVFPFYQEEVHIIANNSVKTFSDLNKKTVVVGQSGSGSWLTAMNMFSITGYRPSKIRRLSPEEGMKAVLTGEADAMIFVAGKPVTLFETLGELSNNPKYADIVENVHLVPVSDGRLLKEYAQSIITPEDYNIVKEDIPTIAVTAVLVSYDFSDVESNYSRERCNDIKRFSAALTENIAALRKTGHPKWKEVDLDAEIGVWKRDKCSAMSSTSVELENEFLNELEIQW